MSFLICVLCEHVPHFHLFLNDVRLGLFFLFFLFLFFHQMVLSLLLLASLSCTTRKGKSSEWRRVQHPAQMLFHYCNCFDPCASYTCMVIEYIYAVQDKTYILIPWENTQPSTIVWSFKSHDSQFRGTLSLLVKFGKIEQGVTMKWQERKNGKKCTPPWAKERQRSSRGMIKMAGL